MTAVSVVIPVYRSEECLVELVSQIRGAMQDQDFEVVLVDDCSPDKSWEVIKHIARDNPRVLGLALRRNVGQDSAIMAGLRVAAGNQIVVMDDDLQHSPQDILKLQAGIGDSDICYAKYFVKEQAKWKNLGSWLNGKIAERLLGKPAHIYLSPFKLMSRGLVDEICRYNGAYPYVDGLVMRSTSKISQIEVKHSPRLHGKGNYNLSKSLRISLRHLTGFSIFPLRLAAVAGVWVSIIGFLILVYFLISYYLNANTPEGWTSLAAIVLCLSGFTLISLGVIGEYLGRSYLSISQKPQYSVWRSTRE